MKIVIDAHIIQSGSGRYVVKLLENLQALDHSNQYLVILPAEDFDSWQPQAGNFSKMAFDYKKFSLLNQFRLARLLYKSKADLVHFTFQPDVFTPLVGLFYIKKKVMTIHDLTQLRIKNRKRSRVVFEILHWFFKLLIRLNAWNMKAIIVPTKFVKNDVHQTLKVKSKKIFVTYEAADEPENKTVPHPIKSLQNSKFILYVGTAHAHKNLNNLVSALPLIQQKHPDLKLVLAGKNSIFHDRLKEQVKKSNVQGVVFTDFVAEAELEWLYENCEAYIFPSLSEGFGLPGLEAMVAGAPVVSSNATCLPEVYGEAAHYFDPTSVEDMSQSINEVLSSSELRHKLIALGHQQTAKYSWQRMAEETKQIYQKL